MLPTAPIDTRDPRRELIRLLRQAALLEHASLLQCLYEAFSLKPEFAWLAGGPLFSHADLMGVAIEEMSHLHRVNVLLGELGAEPCLSRPAFPFSVEGHPFVLQLEPLSAPSLARHVWAEAPPRYLASLPDGDPALAELLLSLGARGEALSTFFDRLVGVAYELPGGGESIAARLQAIQREGEEGHFRFFHAALGRTLDPFRLPPWSAGYPSLPFRSNPSARVERADEQLSNLHYWIALGLLDLHYRGAVPADVRQRAESHMVFALLPLGRLLAQREEGLPFDPPPPGAMGTVARVLALVAEAARREARCAGLDAVGYSRGVLARTRGALQRGGPC